jgi:SAM-dependent methyltransferase
MIIHKLILQHLRAKDDAGFYEMQADDAINWITSQNVSIDKSTQALDLGCGHGIFGQQLARKGAAVIYVDEENYLPESLSQASFRRFNLDRQPIGELPPSDLVICSNVLEHLGRQEQFLRDCHNLLKPGGHLYLSWTNWLSPWGGHEFSPFHYLGPKLGPKCYDAVVRKPRKHTPNVNLFPIGIGWALSRLRSNANLQVKAVVPRYYPEFRFLMSLPVLREFLAWNCAILLKRVK